ncbi:polysaccharide deacetylase family protein [Chloroflexus sp.]|uniref:polysaccharide deacetylase family protein n=1 Tax=Chloroflexus sp. TaxID=1904827 RepID=UPI0026305D33|nr:polysaccharide deacetylase family protein [uncultured Chloroflexus sp.]
MSGHKHPSTIPIVQIAIDPALSAYRAEINYIWRALLTGMGYGWRESAWGKEPVTVVYTATPAQAPPARIVIQARPERWAAPAKVRLLGARQWQGYDLPLLDGDDRQTQPVVENGSTFVAGDPIFAAFWLLSGYEEDQYPILKHGYRDLSDAPMLEDGLLRRAPVSAIGCWLADLLQQCGLPAGLPRWPYGARLAASCGHDVDYPEVVRWLEPLRILIRQGVGGLGTALDVLRGRRTHWHFRSWMELEERIGARSAFYFVARKGSLLEYATGLPDPFYDVQAPHFRALFRELSAAGWEIGLHASYRAYTDCKLLIAERTRLAAASGQPINGNRHHYWHLDPHRPEQTLLMHEQAGFRYDASLTHNRYLGWRRSSVWPFFPWHRDLRRPIRVLQLPTGWMDDHLFGQRRFNPGDRQALLNELRETVTRQEGLLLVDVHDYVYDDALFPGWAATYRTLWETLATQGGVWFAAPAAIADHWLQRMAHIESVSEGLDHNSL